MGRAIYCDFHGGKNEVVGYCTMHRAIRESVEKVAEHLDPENILTRSIVYANLWPMIFKMQEQWRDIERLRRELHGAENELHRILGGG